MSKKKGKPIEESPVVLRDALEFMRTLLTPEEIAESEARVRLIGEKLKARQKSDTAQN